LDGIEFINLMAVTLIALITPLLANLLPKAVRVPAVVLEIVAGIVFGPSGLGWVHIDAPVDVLSLLGFSFLLFLAGLEIDVHRLRGAILRFAILGYLASLAIGLAAGYLFAAIHWSESPLLIGIALAATSSGMVRDGAARRVRGLGREVRPGSWRQATRHPSRGRPRHLWAIRDLRLSMAYRSPGTTPCSQGPVR
jgi:NhaP-type Na+/H+ or K+/H+ antiporter